MIVVLLVAKRVLLVAKLVLVLAVVEAVLVAVVWPMQATHKPGKTHTYSHTTYFRAPVQPVPFFV